MSSGRYIQLEEIALTNFELLLEFWKVPYKQISNIEYDFINIAREDKNFGACRFNVEKGRGADFAGNTYTKNDYQQISMNFSLEDFNLTSYNSSIGFNVIGLCQKLFKINSYKEAAYKLQQDLKEINSNTRLIILTAQAKEARLKKLQEDNLKKLQVANKIWGACSSINGTIAEVYLKRRCIYLDQDEPNMKFHPKILNSETKKILPALLFRIQSSPDSGLCGIHRIYIKQDGSGKALLEEAKVGLGNIKTNAIWLGEKDTTLYIAEGPETALSIRAMGYKFVISTVFANNFSMVTVPDYVNKVVLLPDRDKAGATQAEKAMLSYTKQNKKVKIVFPPVSNNREKTDWNDVLMESYRGSNNVGKR